jgi:hypothetical protein
MEQSMKAREEQHVGVGTPTKPHRSVQRDRPASVEQQVLTILAIWQKQVWTGFGIGFPTSCKAPHITTKAIPPQSRGWLLFLMGFWQESATAPIPP